MKVPPGAPQRDKARSEAEKLSNLTFKKKLEYIWNYYNYHIIAGVLVLAAIAVTLSTRVFNPRPETTLLIAWHAGFAFDEQLSELTDIMTERLIDEDADEIVETALFLTYTDDPMVDMASVQRLIAMVAAGAIDVFILDSELLIEFSRSELVQPMERILEEIQRTNPEIYGRIKDKIIYIYIEEDDGTLTQRIMGIDISDNALLAEIGFFEQDRYFSVSVSSRQLGNVMGALIVLFE